MTRNIGFLSFGLCLAIAPVAHAEEWSKTYAITGKPDLRVETSDANIRVDTWNQNSVAARVTTEGYKIGGDQGIRIEEHQSGDSVSLDVRFPHGISFGFHRTRVEIEIQMPREGQINLRTGDGKIQVRNFKGGMQLASGDGSQSLEGVEGTLRARAGDGHINAAGRFDMLELRTGDGAIEARALAGSTLSAAWDLHAGDGSITLRLPENLPADLELHTGDGRITLDIPVAVEGRLESKDIRGKLNGGGKLLTIHTGDGSIHLERS